MDQSDRLVGIVMDVASDPTNWRCTTPKQLAKLIVFDQGYSRGLGAVFAGQGSVNERLQYITELISKMIAKGDLQNGPFGIIASEEQPASA